MSSSRALSLDAYDAYGFDIDHTLAKYNLPHLFTVRLNFALVTQILPEHFNHLNDSNFIIRMLYKTCTNPVLLTVSTRFLSHQFIVVL